MFNTFGIRVVCVQHDWVWTAVHCIVANCVMWSEKSPNKHSHAHTPNSGSMTNVFSWVFTCLRSSLHPLLMFQSVTFACISTQKDNSFYALHVFTIQWIGCSIRVPLSLTKNPNKLKNTKRTATTENFTKKSARINRNRKRKISNTNTKESKCGVWRGALARKKTTKEWNKVNMNGGKVRMRRRVRRKRREHRQQQQRPKNTICVIW